MCSFTVVRAHTAPGYRVGSGLPVPGLTKKRGAGSDFCRRCRRCTPPCSGGNPPYSRKLPRERPSAPSAPLARECSGIPFRSLQPGQSVPQRLCSLTRTGAASFRIHLPPPAALRCPVCRRKPHQADPASRRYPGTAPPPRRKPPQFRPPASSPSSADFFPKKTHLSAVPRL